jgi:RNA polymerase sigma-70 factor (ECF subfamily)
VAGLTPGHAGLSFQREAWNPERRMTDPASTAELVRRAVDGDARAFDALARTFLRPAYAVALAVVGRPADAEDVAQEAVVTALERIDTCRQPERFGPWLLQSVRNRARNWLEHRKLADVPATDVEVGDPAPAGDGERGATRRQLLRALDAVTPVQREVVLLHDLEGWTHAEIAAALDLSEVSSRQHLFNARRALRARLADPDTIPQETP